MTILYALLVLLVRMVATIITSLYDLTMQASLTGLRQCMPTHVLTFTKHKQPMFNYYYTMIALIFCSNSPQIHLNNHAMCRFQFLPYGMHRFQQTMSTRFTLNM